MYPIQKHWESYLSLSLDSHVDFQIIEDALREYAIASSA
jgi:hypothetical protein